MLRKTLVAILKAIGVLLCGFVAFFGAYTIYNNTLETKDIIGYVLGGFSVIIGAYGIYLCLRASPTSRAAKAQTFELRQTKKVALYERVGYCALPLDDVLQVQDYAVVDVETTGLSPETNEIIEIAAIRSIGGQLSTFSSFVKPRRSIPADVTKLTGIRNADVRNAPRINEIAPQLAAFIDGLPLVAHNAPFDIKFLANAFKAAGIGIDMQYIDTVPLAREAFPGMRNYKLATLIAELDLSDREQQHRAGSDTEATLNLFELCRREIPLRQERERQAREQEAKEEKAYHLNQYGAQAEASGNIEKAISYYEDIVADGVKLPNAYMRLAILYKKRQQWSDVVRVCDAALTVLPGTPGKLCQPEEYEKRRAYALGKLAKAQETGT